MALSDGKEEESRGVGGVECVCGKDTHVLGPRVLRQTTFVNAGNISLRNGPLPVDALSLRLSAWPKDQRSSKSLTNPSTLEARKKVAYLLLLQY